MADTENVKISKRELQVRLYAFATDFSGIVESTADRIVGECDTPEIRESALLWKINAIPALHSQIFVEDPMVGCINAYALCAQMQQLFSSTGACSREFGDCQLLARAAADSVTSNILRLAEMVSSPTQRERLEVRVREFVDEYPLSGLSFAHQSTTGHFASDLDVRAAGGLAAAGAMNEQMLQLNDRMVIYAESAPRQARWQTELALERLPAIADEQREAMVEDARREAVAAWEVVARSLEEQRVATMSDLAAERAAVMDGLAGERAVVLAAMANEREAVIQAIQTIVDRTVDKLDQSSHSTMSQAISGTMRGIRQLLVLVFCGSLLFLGVTWLLARNLILTAQRGRQAMETVPGPEQKVRGQK
jgi:hypothetical protein